MPVYLLCHYGFTDVIMASLMSLYGFTDVIMASSFTVKILHVYDDIFVQYVSTKHPPKEYKIHKL